MEKKTILVMIRWSGDYPDGQYDVPSYVGISRDDAFNAAKEEIKILKNPGHFLYKKYSFDGKQISSKRYTIDEINGGRI